MFVSAEAPAPADVPPVPASPEPVPARIPAPRRPLDDEAWPLRHHPEAAQAAREAVRDLLDAWEVPGELTQAVVLVVSELVTNAVEHARAPLTLRMRRDIGQEVWVGVSDGGPAAYEGPWTASCSREEHGRGLVLVDALATCHGTSTHERGATHWARLSAA